jgi:hypothetical protein
MYVEDLLLNMNYRLSNHVSLSRALDDWQRNFLRSIGGQLAQSKPLSTNQSRASVRLIAAVRRELVNLGMASDDDIDQMLHHPQFRWPLYESSHIPREARYLGDNLLGLRFKQNDEIVQRIKHLDPSTGIDWPRPRFNWEARIWIVPVLRHTLDAIETLLNEYRFQVDPATFDYLRLARQSTDQTSVVTVSDDPEVWLINVRDDLLLAGWVTEIAAGIIV